MKGSKFIFSISLYLFFLPFVAFGQGVGPDSVILKTILVLAPLLSAVFLLYFVYGFVMYTRWYHDDGKQEQGRLAMDWAVIAILVLAVLWGIANWIDEKFYFQSESTVIDVSKDVLNSDN